MYKFTQVLDFFTHMCDCEIELHESLEYREPHFLYVHLEESVEDLMSRTILQDVLLVSINQK